MSKKKKDLVKLDLTAAIGRPAEEDSSLGKWVMILAIGAAIGLVIWGMTLG